MTQKYELNLILTPKTNKDTVTIKAKYTTHVKMTYNSTNNSSAS